MFNILLVDDDGFFANMFENGFDWGSAGCSYAGHAESGQAAIEFLHKQAVDIAFIDMVMPGMKGPELIAYIAANFPGVTCVALSSHDDFDFVKESFRAGAKDYILKHCLNRKEMKRVLDAYGPKPDSIAQPVGAPADDNQAVAKYMTSLFTGKYVQTDADSSLPRSLGLPDLSRDLLLVRTSIVDFDKLRKRYYLTGRLAYIIKSILSMMRAILERHARGVVFFSDEESVFYSLLTDARFESLHFLQHTCELYAQQVKNSCKMYFNAESDSTAAPLCANIRDIRRAYLALHGGEESREPAREEAHIDTDAFFARAVGFLKMRLGDADFEPTRRYLARLYEEGRRFNYTENQFLELTVTLWRACADLAGNIPGAPATGDASEIFSSGESVRAMEARVTELYRALSDAAFGQKFRGVSRHVVEAVRIIHERYENPALSLGMIADANRVSAAYLSRTFKSEMKVGVSEYINAYRIDRARELLLIDRTAIRAVSAKCGFSNYTYFFKVFKRYAGMTPKEFVDRDSGHKVV